MAKSRPSDDRLATFSWKYDNPTVERLLRVAEKKLDDLGRDATTAAPFPRTENPSTGINEGSWKDWIESIQHRDQEDISVLQRFVKTCRVRLGYESDTRSPKGPSGDVGLVITGADPRNGPSIEENVRAFLVRDKAFSAFGNQLRMFRETIKLSQADVAKRIGVTQPQLSRFEQGETLPSDNELRRIAQVYNADFDELKAIAQAAARDVYETATDESSPGNKSVESDSNAAVSESIGLGDQVKAQRKASIGSGCRARRHARVSEKCLGCDEQTEAIANFIRSATGEFCMAVFGRWGRGKTFLLQQVQRKLSSDEYLVTWFNAWKYRTAPELWAHLYETISKTITEDKSLRRIGLGVRAHLVDVGIWRVLVYSFASLFLMLPFTAALQILYLVLSMIGIGVAIYLFLVIRKGRHVISGFQRRFAALASYRSTLGLQAAIGDDLRSIIVAALPNGYFRNREVKYLLGLTATVSLVASAFFFFLPEIFPTAPWLPSFKKWQVSISIAMWWGLFAFFVWSAVWSIPRHNRLLLIVDDLDRCEPKQMLEIIESIKLLIEEEHLHDRVQVVLLIEESLLRQAVCEKFVSFAEQSQKDAFRDAPPIHVLIDEHLDKLFLAYYRFPQLNPSDLMEAAEKVITEQLREVRDELKGRLAGAAAAERDELEKLLAQYEELLMILSAGMSPGASDNAVEVVADTPRPADDRRGKSTDEEKPVVYSSAEIALLTSAISELPKKLAKFGYSFGPRGVRLFIYRYQLVRLLLESFKNNNKWAPGEIIDTMLLAYEERVPNARTEQIDAETDLRNIVKCVI